MPPCMIGVLNCMPTLNTVAKKKQDGILVPTLRVGKSNLEELQGQKRQRAPRGFDGIVTVPA